MQAERIKMEATTGKASLVELAQKGRTDAFNQLVNLWYKRIFNYILKNCGDEEVTEDLAQKTFIAVYKNLKKLKDPGSFKPWLYRIATNNCIQEGRVRARNRTVPLMTPSPDEEDVVSRHEEAARGKLFNPEETFQQRELEQILMTCLQQLPEDQRTVIIMKEYEGMKFLEIAEVLGCSVNTIKSRLYRGLKQMKKILDHKNITKETIRYEL